MKRTVSVPVTLPDERFLNLMNQCASIFNAHIDWAIENKTFNKKQAHKDLYARLRLQYPSVPSALLQTVRDNALEAIKATKFNQTHADLNAAKNVRDDYVSTALNNHILSSTYGTEVQGSVNTPDVSGNSVS